MQFARYLVQQINGSSNGHFESSSSSDEDDDDDVGWLGDTTFNADMKPTTTSSAEGSNSIMLRRLGAFEVGSISAFLRNISLILSPYRILLEVQNQRTDCHWGMALM